MLHVFILFRAPPILFSNTTHDHRLRCCRTRAPAYAMRYVMNLESLLAGVDWRQKARFGVAWTPALIILCHPG